MSKYSEQELASLTPDERSALEAEGADGDDEAALAAIAADGSDEDAKAEDAAGDGVDAEAAAAATAEAQKVADAAAEGKAPATDVDAIRTDRTFHAEVPENMAETRKALRAEDAAALKQLMDGEIDPDAYAAIKDRVSDALEALVRSEVTADVSTRLAADAKNNDWARALNAEVKAAKVDGLDYVGNQDMGAEFDSLLKVYADQASRKGMTDDNLEASKWALAEAGKMMRKMHGTPAKPAPEAKKEDEPAAQRHGLTTLTKLPAADKALISDDVMAKVGSLQGEDLEKFMATLSSKEVERIMAGV